MVKHGLTLIKRKLFIFEVPKAQLGKGVGKSNILKTLNYTI